MSGCIILYPVWSGNLRTKEILSRRKFEFWTDTVGELCQNHSKKFYALEHTEALLGPIQGQPQAQGTPGFYVAFLPALSPSQYWGLSQGISANMLLIPPAWYICEGVGMLASLRDQNMLYRKSLPGMDQDTCHAVEWAGSWECCSLELVNNR